MDRLAWNCSIYADEVFDPIPELEKAQTEKYSSSAETASNIILQHAPPLDLVKVDPTFKPGSDSSWGGELITQELRSSPFINPSLSNIMVGFGAVHQSSEQVKSTGSHDQSLDCLLSATNSNNTSTSVEDDGISVIFSGCRNLWSFGANCGAVSSGESENKEILETVSQSSSDQTKPKSAKRSQAYQTGNCFGLFHQDFSFATETGDFKLIYNENPPKSKKPRPEKRPGSSNISFQQPSSSSISSPAEEPDPEAIAQMKEMIYRAAAFRPVDFGLEIVERTKRKNVKISSDPQTVAARQRRERISERIRVLQRLVPGGTKMDTASMLDEAANYMKFLRAQVKALENIGHKLDSSLSSSSSLNYPPQTNLSFSSALPLFNQSFLPMQTHFPLPQNPSQTHGPQS